MSRILLLILCAIWMSRGIESRQLEMHGAIPPLAGVLIFLGVYVLMVGVMGFWSHRIAARVGQDGSGKRLDRFQRFVDFARYGIIIWFGIAIYGGLSWGLTIDHCLERLGLANRFGRLGQGDLLYEMPGLLLGTFPGILAWMGLWWAQYPIDRATREQHILVRMNENLPVHPPPTFWQFFQTNLRLQMLFILVPALVLVFAHDAAVFLLVHLHASGKAMDAGLENWIMLPAAALMYIYAPELLRHIAHTQRLPDGPLRRRLEEMCRCAGLKYRDILLWKTRHTMSNALVMGLFPRVRYVLLSDMLLETMSDRQIEAVFAHELGHVIHRHLWWLLLVCATVISIVAGPIDLLMQLLPPRLRDGWIEALINFAVAGGGVLAIIGWASHRFERQADVFAARMMQNAPGIAPSFPNVFKSARLVDWHVGEYGAEVFASALRRVAEINHIPMHARDLLHPSIAKRMRLLREMSADPLLTSRFDRFMSRLYLTLLAALFAFGTWALMHGV